LGASDNDDSVKLEPMGEWGPALGVLRDGQDLGRLGLALHASRLSGPWNSRRCLARSSRGGV